MKDCQDDSEIIQLGEIIRTIDPLDKKGLYWTFLVHPLLDGYESSPSLRSVDEAFERWGSVLDESVLLQWREQYVSLHWEALISDFETNGFNLDSPNIFPLLQELTSDLSGSFIHSFVIALTEYCWRVCASLTIPELSQISVPPLIEQTGVKILSILESALILNKIDVRPISSIPNFEEILQLTMHSFLAKKAKDLVFRYSDTFRYFISMDAMYMKLFLLRWSFTQFDSDLELHLLSPPLTASTCAAIKTLLIHPGLVNRSLFTPFLGESIFVIPKEGDELHQYEIQSEFGRVGLLVGEKEIRCCPAQAIILMLFNQKESLYMDWVYSQSPFDTETTNRVVESLTCCERKGNIIHFIEPAEDIQLPFLFRISLGSSPRIQNQESLLDEKDRIASWVMKCVKTKKRISEKAIQKYVAKHVDVDEMSCKQAIEYLMEGEYLRRCDDNPALIELQLFIVCSIN